MKEIHVLPEVELQPKRIELRGVAFTYAGGKTPAIEDIDLEIAAGQLIALVGANGSGKTTLSKVLANLYHPSAGNITWDGVALRDLEPSKVARSITILFQDFLRYEMTLSDNVAIGDSLRIQDVAAVRAALDEVGLTEPAAALPQEIDTFMSPRFPGGHDLSTGQWQRVAMARGLFRDAPIVILDEPTAALDAKAESELFATMRNTLADRTVVLVTHRLASAVTADQILVMSEGRIVERGTHAQLVVQDGLYATMFELQAAAYRSGDASEAM